MIAQILKAFLRTLAHNKSLAAISILGLVLGFSSCILIALFLFDELGYDSYQANLNRIYRVNTSFISDGSVDHIAISAAPLPAALIDNYPEVEASVRFEPKSSGVVVKNKTEAFREYDTFATDGEVFKIFSYSLLHGDPSTALEGPDKVVLTKSAAIKYFGAADVVGNTLEIGDKSHLVTAVIKDVPENSEIRFSLLTSIPDKQAEPDWFDFSYYVFVMFREESLKKPGFLSSWKKNLQTLADENINAAMKKENLDMRATMHIQPLKGLHFDNTLTYDTPKGNKIYVYIFVSAAALILFIACINYINFSIVQSMQQSREIGIRKVVGTSFYQLVARFIAQSLLLTSFAVVIALAVVCLLLPIFSGVVGRNFAVADLFRADILMAVAGISIVTGIFAGIYPAFYSSSVNIVDALKGLTSSPGGKTVRMVSITVQFVVSLGLIIATSVIYAQIKYIRNYDLGFRQDNIIAITTPEDSVQFPLIRAFKEDLLMHHHIVERASIVGDGAMPGDAHDEQRGSITLTNGQGKQEVRMINYTNIDADYFSVLGIKLKSGRSYERGSINDRENSIVVNDALVKALGWADPLSQTIKLGDRERRVIGVVGNVHYKSLHSPIQPQLFVPHNERIVNVFVALKPEAYKRVNQLKLLWQKYFPDEPFVYRYLDYTLQEQYSQEETVVKIATYFSILTIVISVLGTFGLSLLSAYQRRKEIGIRKIVGASFYDIGRLFFREYLIVLVFALVIVTPVAWFMMEQWLTRFINHTSLDITIFVAIGIAFGLLTLATIVVSIRRVAGVKSKDLISSGV